MQKKAELIKLKRASNCSNHFEARDSYFDEIMMLNITWQKKKNNQAAIKYTSKT